jgi:serine/threonine-protein kinase HipA
LDVFTQKALEVISGALPKNPVVVDVGCGPGAQTLCLARALKTPIVALDLVPHFIEELNARAAAEGLEDWVDARVWDMARLAELDLRPDLIWSEGAIYFLGFENALRTWHGLLAPGAFVVCSEATLFVDPAPPEVQEFWQKEMPTIATAEVNVRRARAAGYEVLTHFPLPREAWVEGYFAPLLARADVLFDEAKTDPDLESALAESRGEAAFFEKWHAAFGYVFYVMKKVADQTT